MKKVATIIVTYNAMKWAERCFTSLRQSSVPLNIIVVDNGSTDGTQDFIKKNFPEVDFIQSPENLGFGKANNIGIEKAYNKGAEFFYLMNQDAWIFPNTVQELLNVWDASPAKNNIGILSPIHVDGTEKNLDIFFEKYLSQNFEKTRVISDYILSHPRNCYEVNFINAAHWFLPKNTIEKVGGFNPYFFHYGEDNEYVNRLKYHELTLSIVTKSIAVHDGKQDLKKVDYNVYRDLTAETNIMNPAYPDAFQKEVKAYRQSIIKNLLSGNISSTKKLSQKLTSLRKEKNDLINYAAIVKTPGASFLNLH